MKPPHCIKGYSESKQRAVTARTISILIDLGFVAFDAYYRIRVGDLHLAIQPPVIGQNSSWQLLCYHETEKPNIGGNGTLSFSAKWATPGKVIHSALCKLYNTGYAIGVADARGTAMKEVLEFVKRIEEKL